MPKLLNNLVVCIPTANRPQMIHDCLKSILVGSALPGKIIVLDSSAKKIFKEIENIVSILKQNTICKVDLQHSDKSLSPSEARHKLAKASNSEFIMYLDDDMAVKYESVEVMYETASQSANIDILGCGVYEYGVWRDIGFNFDVGVYRDQMKFVSKRAIRKEWMDLHSINLLQVDLITQPPFLVRRSVFKKVDFDVNYKWSYEIFDFFFNCFKKGITCFVTTSTHVNHYPSKYIQKTLKNDKIKLNRQGKKYFEEKWLLTPVKEFRKGIIFDLFIQLLWSIRRRKMVKNKIKKDGVRYN